MNNWFFNHQSLRQEHENDCAVSVFAELAVCIAKIETAFLQRHGCFKPTVQFRDSMPATPSCAFILECVSLYPSDTETELSSTIGNAGGLGYASYAAQS